MNVWSGRAGARLMVAVFTLAAGAAPAMAEPIKCQRAIAKAHAQFVQTTAKAAAKCAAAVVADPGDGPCPNAAVTTAIANATAKLDKAIGKACGGDDKICGGDYAGEDLPAALGWPKTCPNFEHGTCVNSITTCSGIATCLACLGRAAAEQAIALPFDDLALPSSGPLHTCQATIGKATNKFLAARSKALLKCRDARLLGKHADDCVPPAVGDGKYVAAIAKAEDKKVTAICKACGGADTLCDGVNDLTPGAIGFPTVCPTVTVPGGAACGGPITDLASLVACVDCVTAFDTACMDRVALPGLTSYPSACNACLEPPASGPCPTALEFTADGPAVDLDTGFVGYAHNAKVPTNGRLTLAISGCAGSNQPTCGQCNVNGPFENAGGIAFDNHRCADASWIGCATDGDCTTAGAAGPCAFFFGPPLPLDAGGVSTCVVNRIAGPVDGTVNLDDGTSTTNVPLASSVYVGGTVSHPCPLCSGGTCQDGPRLTLPCSVQGSGENGDVSLDCPPPTGTFGGTLDIKLAIATGTQTRTLSSANPQCTAGPAYAGFRCQCDTCNDLAQEACASNADCPPSGGNPGICGGRRCIGGLNAGNPCLLASACPGGSCGRPGLGTQPSACVDDTSTPVDGSLCEDIGENEGECPDGPITPICSVETFRGCTSDAACNPPPFPGSTCLDCLSGQTCKAVRRPCFTDNGAIGGTVSVAGTADVPCGGVSYPTVGSLFCVAPVDKPAVNTATGLPGLGRIRIPGRVVVAP